MKISWLLFQLSYIKSFNCQTKESRLKQAKPSFIKKFAALSAISWSRQNSNPDTYRSPRMPTSWMTAKVIARIKILSRRLPSLKWSRTHYKRRKLPTYATIWCLMWFWVARAHQTCNDSMKDQKFYVILLSKVIIIRFSFRKKDMQASSILADRG